MTFTYLWCIKLSLSKEHQACTDKLVRALIRLNGTWRWIVSNDQEILSEVKCSGCEEKKCGLRCYVMIKMSKIYMRDHVQNEINWLDVDQEGIISGFVLIVNLR